MTGQSLSRPQESTLTKFRTAASTLVLIVTLPLISADSVSAQPPRPFAALVDDCYAALFDFEPNLATYAGIHDHDHKIVDLSTDSVRRRVDALKAFHVRLKALRAGTLSE